MDNHYRIMGNCRGEVEEIDCSDDKKEAKRLVNEYKMAFGPSWKVWIEVQTFDHTGTLGGV
jgi:hypothetical protein